MKYSIVYSSKTGNTKMLADEIKKILKKDDCLYFGKPDDKALASDRIYIGFWTDRGECDSETIDFLRTIKNKEIFLFGTAGFGESEKYFKDIIERIKKYLSDDVKILDYYMCQGKMPFAVRERYVNMKNTENCPPNIDMMINNFDKALSHPDKNDLKLLKDKISLFC